jgi:hypothetical protein
MLTTFRSRPTIMKSTTTLFQSDYAYADYEEPVHIDSVSVVSFEICFLY